MAHYGTIYSTVALSDMCKEGIVPTVGDYCMMTNFLVLYHIFAHLRISWVYMIYIYIHVSICFQERMIPKGTNGSYNS